MANILLHDILSHEVRIFPGDLGLWHQVGCMAFQVRQSLSRKSHENAGWSSLPVQSLNRPEVGLRTETCYHSINVSRREREKRFTEIPIVAQQNAEWSFSLTNGDEERAFQPLTFQLPQSHCNPGCEEHRQSDRRSRVLTPPDRQDDDSGKGRQHPDYPRLSHSHWSLLSREHLPGKSVIAVNYQRLYLVTINIKTLLEKIFKYAFSTLV